MAIFNSYVSLPEGIDRVSTIQGRLVVQDFSIHWSWAKSSMHCDKKTITTKHLSEIANIQRIPQLGWDHQDFSPDEPMTMDSW